MAVSQWFYVDAAGLRQGPVASSFLHDALRRGEVQHDTLVWRDGLSQWVALQQAASELGIQSQTPVIQPPAYTSTGGPGPLAPPQSGADFGLALLAVPSIAALLIWFWVGNMNLLQSPGSSLTLIMWGTVIGTAILAATEASRHGMVSNRTAGTYSPTSWFFILLLLWIIGYPVYLYKRRSYGLPNLCAIGLIVALIFVGSYGLMESAIEAKIAELQGMLPK